MAVCTRFVIQFLSIILFIRKQFWACSNADRFYKVLVKFLGWPLGRHKQLPANLSSELLCDKVNKWSNWLQESASRDCCELWLTLFTWVYENTTSLWFELSWYKSNILIKTNVISFFAVKIFYRNINFVRFTSLPLGPIWFYSYKIVL